MNLATLTTLEALEREMVQTGRGREAGALREALNALARPERGCLTIGHAAERLGVSIPTIKRWIECSTLTGGALGGRWVVSPECDELLVRLRESHAALDREGKRTLDEVRSLSGLRPSG